MQGNNSLEGTPNMSPIHSPELNRRLAELAEHQNEPSENITETDNENPPVDSEIVTHTDDGDDTELPSEVNEDETAARDDDQVDEIDGDNAEDASRSEAVTELVIDENHFSSPVQNGSLMGSPVVARRTRFGSNNASEDYYNSEVRSLQTRQHNNGELDIYAFHLLTIGI